VEGGAVTEKEQAAFVDRMTSEKSSNA